MRFEDLSRFLREVKSSNAIQAYRNQSPSFFEQVMENGKWRPFVRPALGEPRVDTCQELIESLQSRLPLCFPGGKADILNESRKCPAKVIVRRDETAETTVVVPLPTREVRCRRRFEPCVRWREAGCSRTSTVHPYRVIDLAARNAVTSKVKQRG